jgi:AcrR family transcriptional regulator
MSEAEAARESVEAPLRGEAVRTALVEAAAALLADAGPRAVSVRDVARRAGVNHGQVHHYFGGKRGLLRAAMRHLAARHLEHTLELSDGGPIPPALSLAGDPDYWRAVCQVVMEGDLELARLEIDEGISVPRRALDALSTRRGVAPDDLDFKARFAALAALQLGWVAFEDFMMLIADVPEQDREALRERVRAIVVSFVEAESPSAEEEGAA